MKVLVFSSPPAVSQANFRRGFSGRHDIPLRIVRLILHDRIHRGDPALLCPPPSSLVQLRAADNSYGARDTRPFAALGHPVQIFYQSRTVPQTVGLDGRRFRLSRWFACWRYRDLLLLLVPITGSPRSFSPSICSSCRATGV